ncbi:MAG: 1-acyl-sn-glycerol-3-phosphate acyltransferase [Bdellovibrionota bacterium]
MPSFRGVLIGMILVGSHVCSGVEATPQYENLKSCQSLFQRVGQLRLTHLIPPDKLPPSIPSEWIDSLGPVMGLPETSDVFEFAARQELPTQALADGLLKRFKIRVQANDLPKILNSSTPIVVVGNHPTGFVDVLSVLSQVIRERPNLRVLAAPNMKQIPILGDSVIPTSIGKIAGGQAVPRGETTLRISNFLKGSKSAVIGFPSGSVATFDVSKGRIEEGPWKSGIFRAASEAHAAIVPVRLKTAFREKWYCSRVRRCVGAFYEIKKLSDQPFELIFGEPIPYETYKDWGDPRDVASRVQTLVSNLK